MTNDGVAGSPIEAYLDQVLAASAGASPRATRRLLAETEDHLRDIAQEVTESGGTSDEAEHAAVARFGSVDTLVGPEAGARRPLTALIRPAAGTSLLLGGLAGLAIGVSGLITAILGYVAGSTFIVNVSQHMYLAPSDCARWLSQNHTTHSCYQAALQDWSFEVVAYRVVLGVLGLAALLVYWRLGRRWSARRLTFNLPRSPVNSVAFVGFAGAGLWLGASGVDSLIVSAGRGAGQGLGTAPTLLILGAVFGWRFITDLRATPARA
ncbi:MAG: permease prefix domain 1-containing protein [Acidimicrobiales bacterium]